MTAKTTKRAPKDPGTFSIWLCTPAGFYAIAHRWPGSYDPEKDPRDIMVRARKRKHLDRLRHTFLPELGKDEGLAGQGTDYGHRAFCTSEQLARAMARMALTIDACGFKAHVQDQDLHDAFMRTWNAMLDLDDNSPYGWHASQAWQWQHKPHPQDCVRYGEHFWSHSGGPAKCLDCGARRYLKAGGYRFTHPKGSIRLTDAQGSPLPVTAA